MIGAETTSDEKLVLDRHFWGFELQAKYIECLLSGDYLAFLPIWWGFVLFALFIFCIEGLPTFLVARRPRWRHLPLIRFAYPHRRFVWVGFWTVTIIVVTGVAALTLRYLPPLLAYGEILFISITRIMFFLVESAEDPFLHAHNHRKEHTMSSHSPSTASKPTTAATPEQAPVQQTLEPFDPGQAPEPAPAPPGSNNNPGTEAATEG